MDIIIWVTCLEPQATPFMYVCEYPMHDFHFIFYDKNGEIMN